MLIGPLHSHRRFFRGRNSLYIFPLILSLAFEILFYILLSILKGILWRKDQFLGLTRLRVLKVLMGGRNPIFLQLENKTLVFSAFMGKL